MNVRGLNTKVVDLFNFTTHTDCNMVCLTETWLNSNVHDSEICCDKFHVFRCDRKYELFGLTRGGGCLIMINKTFTVNLVNLEHLHTNFSNIDIVGVKIMLKSGTLFVFVVYIPPNSNTQLYNSFFDCLSNMYEIYGSDLLIIGDFNIPEYSEYLTNRLPPTTKISELQNLCSFFDLAQYNMITNTSGRLLDLVLYNKTCTVTAADIKILREDVHHPPLSIDIHHFFSVNDSANAMPKRYNFKKANFESLYADLCRSTISDIYSINNVNDAVNFLYNFVNESVSRFVPQTTISKIKYPPWFTKKIIQDIRRKTIAFKSYKRSGSSHEYESFKALRNSIKVSVQHAHREYLKTVERNLSNNPCSFWAYLNFRKASSSNPQSMSNNNVIFNNPQDIANEFASYFGSVHIQSSDCQLNESSTSTSITLGVITERDVLNAFKKLKPRFTAGPDGLPAFFIKDCARILAAPLTHIFNISVKSSKFPDNWKISKVCPIYKKGNKAEIVNYRPIAVINNFAKLFEFVLHNLFYSQVKHIICENQHGFMTNRSINTNLISVTQYLSEHMEKVGQVDVIYTDFSKAFDRIDHGILLTKLCSIGFHADLVAFLQSYLTGRRQYVLYLGRKSYSFPTLSGVPQGSVLGPLLFNLFINDIVSELSCSSLLYADDMKLFCSIKSFEDCCNLQNNLNNIQIWCFNNGLQLNIDKCNVVSYTRKTDKITFDYSIDGHILRRETICKDLGVTFDYQLSFKDHLQSISKSGLQNLGFIMRNSHDFSDVNTLFILFNALVRPKIEYASAVWSPHYDVHINTLESLLRKFLKFLAFKLDHQYPHIGIDQGQLLARFNCVSMARRRDMQGVLFLFKLLNGLIDSSDILQKIYFRASTASTRSTSLFYFPSARTNVLMFSPLYRMCRSYEEVEEDIDIFNTTIGLIKSKFLVV